MALVTVNGHGAIRGAVYLPRVGVWHAELDLDTAEKVTGAVEIHLGQALVLKGTVESGGRYGGATPLRIVGGANGLGKKARPQHYVKPMLRVPLADLLRGAGEKLSGTSDSDVVGQLLNAWTIIEAPTGEQLTALVTRAAPDGTVWRVLPDGSVWLGKESWPVSSVEEWRELGAFPRENRLELGLDVPTLLPGTTLGGQRVDYCAHIIDGEKIRTTAWVLP
jgi:hypothetical protein